jgi:formylglycine-generating enzyme required for sulfatase activity
MIGLIGFSSCGNNDHLRTDDNPSPVKTSCLTEQAVTVNVPSGISQLGSNEGYIEERPARNAEISGFNIDLTEVTNEQFTKFIAETDYVTSAERIQPGFDMAGAAVFTPPNVANPSWWRFVENANWRHPDGPESSIEGREHDPVVQVSHEDAKAYAAWAGRALPTEAQWEYAARAGSQTRYIWGESRTIDGLEQANTWQGAFPIQNTEADGFFRRAPVGCFSPNAFGLYDMIGNVWEWTDTIYQQSEGEPVYTIKGGSFLCAANYCRRYRPAARQPQEAGFPTNHIGFRTVSVSE